MRKKVKICLTCSAGGHFQQIKLATACLPPEKYEVYWVTMPAKHLTTFFKDKHHITVMNTEMDKKWTVVVNLFQSVWYLLKERPDVIISTGAGVSFFTIFFGKKLLGCKIIYICSAANVVKSSRTPLKVYKYSDLFLVQWPEMMKIFPKAKYIGVL